MRERTLPRGLVRELAEIDVPLRAALGAKYAGASLRGSEITLHLNDDASDDDVNQAHALAVATANAIDPGQPAPSVAKRQRVTTATEALQQVDFADIKARIEAISTVAQAKTEMLRLARAIWQLAVIMSLNEQDEA